MPWRCAAAPFRSALQRKNWSGGTPPSAASRWEAISPRYSSSRPARTASWASRSTAAAGSCTSASRSMPFSHHGVQRAVGEHGHAFGGGVLEDGAAEARARCSARGRRPASKRFIGSCRTRKWWPAPPASRASSSIRVREVNSGSIGRAHAGVGRDAVGARCGPPPPRSPGTRTPPGSGGRTPARRFSSVPWLRSWASVR